MKMKNLFKKLTGNLFPSKNMPRSQVGEKCLMGFSSRGANVTINNKPPSEPPKARRHFEFERKQYPWMPHSGYENLGQQGNQNVRLAPWGREYTDHAIDSTLPSGNRYSTGANPYHRSVMPSLVERTIAYGNPQVDSKGRKSYTLGEIQVGLTSDESKVFHVKYKHK